MRSGHTLSGGIIPPASNTMCDLLVLTGITDARRQALRSRSHPGRRASLRVQAPEAPVRGPSGRPSIPLVSGRNPERCRALRNWSGDVRVRVTFVRSKDESNTTHL